MAYFSPGRVTLQQFVFIFVYIWVVFGLYLGDNDLLQSKKSDFATGQQKEKTKNKSKAFTGMKNEETLDFFKNMNNFEETNRTEEDDLA